MKDTINELFQDILQNSSEKDADIILQLLKGLKFKQENPKRALIDGILHMDRKVEDKQCEITIPVSPLIFNSLQIVHGGITATLLDTAMGTLANAILPNEKAAVTSQMNIHYTAVGKGDYLRCIANVTHEGKQTMVIEGKVFRDDGTLMSFATGTFFIIDRPGN